MLNNFAHLLPEVIFEAAEKIGGRCTGRFLALNAMENRVYDIEMEDEPNRIIKFYRPGRWDKATIQAEHDFLKACEIAEVPVVCPMANAAGETLLEINVEGGTLLYTLFPKKPGRLEPELNGEQLKRLGRFLGRIHNVGAEFKKVARLKLDAKTYGRDCLEYLLKENLLAPGLSAIYQKYVNDICTLVDPMFEGKEYVLTHGDCHAGNVLWQHDNPYFIDFDDMLYAPPVQDFWMLIGGDDEIAMKNRDILIDSYMEIREFDESTVKLVEPLRALRMIYFSTWIARRREDGAFKAAFPHFGTEKYWQEQIEHLSHQLERLKASTQKPEESSGYWQ